MSFLHFCKASKAFGNVKKTSWTNTDVGDRACKDELFQILKVDFDEEQVQVFFCFF